jgi:hypothetical protein
MAYLVTDRTGRREFRWLEGGRRRSRRVPRGQEGDRLLVDLRAAHDIGEGTKKAIRDEVAEAVAEADDMRRELEELDTSTRMRLNGMLHPPLSYDHVHGTITRSDRMSREKIKAAAAADAKAGTNPKPRRDGWVEEGQPVGMDPTHALRSRLAAKFCADDPDRKLTFLINLMDIEAELLDGDESPVARMLAGHLVLTWVHSLWADNELVWETHRVGVAPRATVAMTRRAESLSGRFLAALRLWESHCLRTRGEVTAFPTPAANRIGGYFAGVN